MTEGTSQGLFIVVAIVIFGIFVSLSYTLFGKTLQPQIVGLFTKSTEQVNDKLLSLKRKNLFPDSNFEKENTLVDNFQGRGGSYLNVDKVNLHEGNNTLHNKFTGSGGQFKYTEDTVIWLTDNRFKDAIIDDVLTISFYAKSKENVNLTGRLGSVFQLTELDNAEGKGMQTISLTPQWDKYILKFNIEKNAPTTHKAPAFVYWLDKEGEVWLSDLKVELDKELVEK